MRWRLKINELGTMRLQGLGEVDMELRIILAVYSKNSIKAPNSEVDLAGNPLAVRAVRYSPPNGPYVSAYRPSSWFEGRI